MNLARFRLSALVALVSFPAFADPQFPTPWPGINAPGLVIMCPNGAGSFQPCGSPGALPIPTLSYFQAGNAAIGKVGVGYTAVQSPAIGIGTGTTAAVTATLPAVAGKMTYICGFDISADAAALAVGNATVTGVANTLTYGQTVNASTSGFSVLSKTFTPCLPASASNTAIVVTSVAAGTSGVTNVNVYGYQE